MPYDTRIEERIEAVVRRWKPLSRKRMFGGIGYLLRGNMCFGIHRGFLIVRTGKDSAERFLREAEARPFDITGRAMAGWVMVDRRGWDDPERLKAWLNRGRRFAASLPPKDGGAS